MSVRAPVCVVSTGALAALLVTANTPSVRADDVEGVAQRCIYVDRIDQTRIVDERSILFFMRDHTVLQNVLPNSCLGLRTTDRIKYDATLGKLCANEFVTQLIDIGSYAPGTLCRIGMFVPIGAEEARSLLPARKGKHDHPSSGRAIEAKPVELPPAAPEPASTAPESPQTSDQVEPARAAEPERR